VKPMRTAGPAPENACRDPMTSAPLAATLSTLDGAMATPCFVEQVSPAGVRLTLGLSTVLAQEMRISIPVKDIEARARLVWRQGDQAGLVFRRPAPASSPADRSEDDTLIAALERRVASLKAEIEVLRLHDRLRQP